MTSFMDDPLLSKLGRPSVFEVYPDSVLFRKGFADDDAAVTSFPIELGKTLNKIEYSNLWKCCASLKTSLVLVTVEEFCTFPNL